MKNEIFCCFFLTAKLSDVILARPLLAVVLDCYKNHFVETSFVYFTSLLSKITVALYTIVIVLD